MARFSGWKSVAPEVSDQDPDFPHAQVVSFPIERFGVYPVALEVAR